MPVYLTPGVYIEEIERGPRPIEGVPTSIAAFLGEAQRGPTKPILVTSYREYQRWFGGIFGPPDHYLPYAVNGFFENGGQDLYVCRIVGQTAVAATLAAFGDFTVNAVGAGTFGNQVWVAIEDSTTKVKNVPVGFRVKVAYWTTLPPGGAFDPFDPANWRNPNPPTLTENFDDLSIDPMSVDYYDKRLKDNSALITLIRTKGINTKPTNNKGLLAGGKDDPNPLTKPDFVGDLAGARTVLQGLTALTLDPYRDVSLVHAPYPVSDQVNINLEIINHCELNRFRFAVVDCDPNTSDVAKLDPRTTIADTEYAAFYYPWVWISDPQSGARKLVPPSGYALGVYARVDSTRGVYKAPANETPMGVVQLEFDINDGKQGQLNPRGVNCYRSFAGRGILIWGARTLSSNTLWKYISVRRLFIFLERSIYEGTQWVVFEPNDQKLWARVKDSIRLFLRTQWRAGALMGTKEEDAFFITCDRTTMTQDDILNGRLICEIGIAPTRPAEFVIFRIFQNTAEPQS